jgi:VCBS repeat-containing protein
MKRALALAGSTLALLAVTAGPAAAQDPTTCYVPVQYCPAPPPTPDPTSAQSETPAPAPTPAPVPTTTEPSTAPTVDPPAATSAEKKAAVKDAEKALGGDATFAAQIGSAVVSTPDAAPQPTKNGKITALALTVDPGAKVQATGSVKLENGKTLKLPTFSTTVGADGQLTITLKLTSKQLKQLKKAGTGTISLAVQVTDSYGTHTKTVKVDVSSATTKKSKKG